MDGSPRASEALERLMAAPDVYHLDAEKDALFVEAMRAAVAHHRANSAAFAALCEQTGFCEDTLAGVNDLSRVPHLFVNALKKHELLSMDRVFVALHLTSSGTTGQKSQIFFDEGSLQRGLAMVEACFAANGLVDRASVANYLIFAHDPRHAGARGTTYTDHHLTGFTAKGTLHYALQWSAVVQDWHFDLEGTDAVLEQFARSGLPLRIIGFPAFLHRLLAHRAQQGRPPLAFASPSYVLTGGGWKTHLEAAIPREAFIREVTEHLGIPHENQRDGYGLVEHGVPYLECSQHRFHVPHFARAITRDIETLEPLPDGQRGFLNLLTPYLLSMPAISLLTSDLAVTGHDCPCGRNTATVSILGRAGTRKNKGCAITAAQLLQGG